MLAFAAGIHADERGLAERWGLTGAVRTDWYQSSKTFDGSQGFAGATVQAEVRPKFGERLDSKVSMRAGVVAPDRPGAAGAELIEGFATVHFESADLRIGKQIVPWGRADGINPTDNLTPRDYALLLPFEDDQRLGVWSVKLDVVATSIHTLSVFFAPEFAAARLPWPGGVRPAQDRPVHSGQFGVRLNVVSEGFDWSVSYFRGRAHIPSVRLLDGRRVLRYDRIRVFGADVARNFGRFGVRGEVAFSQTDDKDGRDPFTRNPQIYWVGGIDRTFFDDLNLNFQVFQRVVRAYRPLSEGPADVSAVALQSTILAGQRDRINNGFTFRVGDKWMHDTLQAEILCIANTTRHDVYVRPLLTYAFTDDWKGTVGAEYYGGRGDTQFGSQKVNKGVFAELRRSF